jgi:hypothetical protein
MGKYGQADFVFLIDWPMVPLAGICLLFPALRGLPPEDALALAMLPIHDANGLLLDALRGAPAGGGPFAPAFAAVCLSDPFRRMDDVFAALRSAGITGVINLPTIASLMSGSRDLTFGALYERECAMLARADAAGFHVVKVVCDDAGTVEGEIRISELSAMARPKPSTTVPIIAS